ncbi:phragmoplastin DRP1E-like [Rutidosis leptorrhynchoides]|uniref:phragmoplastin DRP1E-like n=1 Tax=Rutidosis leptorrhynchoides TaxID=125765 RepID=UPI003A9916B4
MDKGINGLDHLEPVIKEKVPDIGSLLNKNIYMMEAELDRIGRPVAVDAGSQLYTILELCRAFNKIFNKNLNGGFHDPWHIFSRVLLSHIKTIIETEGRAKSSGSEVSSPDGKNEYLWYD